MCSDTFLVNCYLETYPCFVDILYVEESVIPSLSQTLVWCLDNLLTPLYMDSPHNGISDMDPSFYTVMKDNSPGGLLVRELFGNLHDQFGKSLPLHLTSAGLDAVKILVIHLNALFELTDFQGDINLFTYLSGQVKNVYNIHFDIFQNDVVPFNPFLLPLGNQVVPNAYDSGVYGFFHQVEHAPSDISIHLGIGSATSCRSRLVDHMASLKGHRPQQFMHKFILDNGGFSNTTWSPLITTSNMILDWNKMNASNNKISLGATNVLRGFAQLPIRMLEQAMMDKYCPSMNPGNNLVLFFNFPFDLADFSVPVTFSTTYQAFDSTMSTILVESNSYNSLSKLVGLSNVSVRNNMD
jgi:hypothetical protein